MRGSHGMSISPTRERYVDAGDLLIRRLNRALAFRVPLIVMPDALVGRFDRWYGFG